jgi:hypothetical protein
MTTDLVTLGFVRTEDAAERAATNTSGAKAVSFSWVWRRKRDNSVLSVLAVLLLSGCSDPARLSVNEYYQLGGVQDVEAPNRVLFEWSRPGVAQAPRGGPVKVSLSGLFQGDKCDTLDLVNVELTDAIRGELRASHQVKWLRLPATIRASDLDWIGQMKQLRGLSLNGADLHGADFRTLESLSGLQWLNLYGAKMDEADIATLPSLKKLQNLNLGHSGLTDNGIHHLVSLELPSLHVLSLSDAMISDDGMEQLCAKYQLRCLNLYCVSNVTKRSVDAIGRMKSLRLIGIGLSGISPDCTPNADVKRLQKLLPRCVVDYGD